MSDLVSDAYCGHMDISTAYCGHVDISTAVDSNTEHEYC